MTKENQKNCYRAAKEAYGEVKRRYNVTLTQSVVNFLDKKAEHLGLSRSELMERIFRSMALKDDSLNWYSFADKEKSLNTQELAGESSSSRFKQAKNRNPSFLLQPTSSCIGNIK